ncbi:hypothetical protein QOZ86_13555 [Blastococcus capsensis]|nr:hypothetical protein [Blastococcus capsensis]MDK3257527.1 hypothetical protein [Blastococcus capsensis]
MSPRGEQGDVVVERRAQLGQQRVAELVQREPGTSERGRRRPQQLRPVVDGGAASFHETVGVVDDGRPGLQRWCITVGQRCYTSGVPTARPRHMVTETDELAVALDAAAARCPGLSRSQLLTRLALDGHRAAQQAHDERRRRRLSALRRHSGDLTGVYGSGYLGRLREEWPA